MFSPALTQSTNQQPVYPNQRNNRKRKRQNTHPGRNMSCLTTQPPTYDSKCWPSRILCFFWHPVNNCEYALVHSSNAQVPEEHSSLVQIWEHEYKPTYAQGLRNGRRVFTPILREVPVDAIEDRLYALSFSPMKETLTPQESRRFLVVINRKRFWGKAFFDHTIYTQQQEEMDEEEQAAQTDE